MNRKSVIKPLDGINLNKKLKLIKTEEDDQDDKIELNLPPKTSKKQQLKSALEEDQEIFDYDQFLDRSKPKMDEDRRPKYMADLIKNAMERKMIYESIKAKKLESETSEQFVTEAYKKEKERLLELEREKDAALDKSQKGVDQFYKNLYKEKTSRGPLILGDKSLATKLDLDADAKEEEDDIPVIASSVIVNESNEVIDKRQLLKGGLNVSQKLIKRQREKDKEQEAALEKTRRERDLIKKQRHQEQVERNLAYVKRQHEKMGAEKEKKKEDTIDIPVIPAKIDSEKVMDAKARYLARKRQQ